VSDRSEIDAPAAARSLASQVPSADSNRPPRLPGLTIHANTPGRKSTSSLRGFTLIELVVVMAIIAILALMAVPIYRDKFIRDQVVEAMRLADIAKGPIATAWTTTRTFPDDNAAAGLPAPDKVVSNYVKSLTVEAGAIHVVFGNQASGALRGMTLSLRPAVVEDAPVVPVAWVCGFAAVPEKMTVTAGNRTNLPKGWLPVNCR
jgi:type IV pilus assembly protein PilA